jgi:hypothetical protein
MFIYDFSRFKSKIFIYGINIFMIEGEQKNKTIILKLEIHIKK